MGELETCCYLIWEEKSKKCLVVDVGSDGVELCQEIDRMGLKPIGVAATHGHFDHVLAALEVKLIYQVDFYCSSLDKFLLKRQDETVKYFLRRMLKIPNIKIDRDLSEIEEIKIGSEKLKLIKTPGHTPGGVCFYDKKGGWLISGDTLFKDARGLTEYKYSSTDEMFKSLYRLMQLPDKTLVLPGHGEETTIGKERGRYNFREENKI